MSLGVSLPIQVAAGAAGSSGRMTGMPNVGV